MVVSIRLENPCSVIKFSDYLLLSIIILNFIVPKQTAFFNYKEINLESNITINESVDTYFCNIFVFQDLQILKF